MKIQSVMLLSFVAVIGSMSSARTVQDHIEIRCERFVPNDGIKLSQVDVQIKAAPKGISGTVIGLALWERTNPNLKNDSHDERYPGLQHTFSKPLTQLFANGYRNQAVSFSDAKRFLNSDVFASEKENNAVQARIQTLNAELVADVDFDLNNQDGPAQLEVKLGEPDAEWSYKTPSVSLLVTHKGKTTKYTKCFRYNHPAGSDVDEILPQVFQSEPLDLESIPR